MFGPYLLAQLNQSNSNTLFMPCPAASAITQPNLETSSSNLALFHDTINISETYGVPLIKINGIIAVFVTKTCALCLVNWIMYLLADSNT